MTYSTNHLIYVLIKCSHFVCLSHFRHLWLILYSLGFKRRLCVDTKLNWVIRGIYHLLGINATQTDNYCTTRQLDWLCLTWRKTCADTTRKITLERTLLITWETEMDGHCLEWPLHRFPFRQETERPEWLPPAERPTTRILFTLSSLCKSRVRCFHLAEN